MAVGVKVCGLTEAPRLAEAAAGGARFVGFIFYPPSPRSLTPERAAALIAAAPSGPSRVGVFVDPDDDWLKSVLAEAPLDIIQLHGHETPERVEQVRARTGCKVMKALRIADAADLAPLADFATVADLILFDAKPPSRPGAVPGGNGLPFDWTLLEGVDLDVPWLLAGGLDADNLAAAVRLTGARLVDVSTGIEHSPGIKDPDKLARFLAVARDQEAAAIPTRHQGALS